LIEKQFNKVIFVGVKAKKFRKMSFFKIKSFGGRAVSKQKISKLGKIKKIKKISKSM